MKLFIVVSCCLVFASLASAQDAACRALKDAVIELKRSCNIDKQLCGAKPTLSGDCGIIQEAAYEFSKAGCTLCEETPPSGDDCALFVGTESVYDEYCATVCITFCVSEKLSPSECAKKDVVSPFCKYEKPVATEAPSSSTKTTTTKSSKPDKPAEKCEDVHAVGNVQPEFCKKDACNYCATNFPSQSLESCIEKNFAGYCTVGTQPTMSCDIFKGNSEIHDDFCKGDACNWCKAQSSGLKACMKEHYAEYCRDGSNEPNPSPSTTTSSEAPKPSVEICKKIVEAADHLRSTGCSVEDHLCGKNGGAAGGNCGVIQQAAKDLFSSGCDICKNQGTGSKCDDYVGTTDAYTEWCRTDQCQNYCVASGSDLASCMAAAADFCRLG